MLTMDTAFNSLHNPALTCNGVDVWCASLQQPSEIILQLDATLSDEEHGRADRFQFEPLRQAFIIARGLLRSLLAHYLNLMPGQLCFEYTRTGKPFLSNHYGVTDIFFNLSHSNDLVLYAFTRNRQVGIDVEYIRQMSEIEDIAAHTFSVEENNQLRSVANDQKLEAFFNCWTRKEAFIKAIGDGVSFPLDQFDVTLRPGDPAKILRIFGSEEQAARWIMHELRPAAGYSAALVLEGNDCSLRYREWNHVEHAHSMQEPK